MWTFAQKSEAAQQNTSARSTISDRAQFGLSGHVNTILHVQRMVGDHAEQLRQPKPDGLAAVFDPSAHGRCSHDFSRIPVPAPASETIQPRLAVNNPGDTYEDEAERISERVMRMPEPPQRCTCSSGGECPKCQTEQPDLAPARLQTKRVGANDAQQIEAPPIVLDVLAAPGQPLDSTTRGFMEPRFGHDFSQVRVHADAKAAQSAHAVNALAYTVGRHMVFGERQYQPSTDVGRRLLAHELSHTIQQGAALRHAQPGVQSGKAVMRRIRPTIQRKMKFEFQTRNRVTATDTKTGKSRAVGRKFGEYLHKGTTGVRVETDTGGVVEVETGGWFRRWSKLKAAIQEAVDFINDIKAKKGVGIPFSEESRLRKQGLLKKTENLEVTISDPNFKADIQSSEGIALSQYESLLKEHERPQFVDPVIKSAQNILDAAVKASKKVKPGTKTDNLRSFLQMIVNYIERGQNIVSGVTGSSPVKATFRLMHRTNFASVYKSLLSPDEQTLFKEIVKTKAIPLELGLAATDPFFKEGYWGHAGGMMALFQGGKIIALATEDQNNIYDCTTKKAVKGTTTGINVSKCGVKVAGTNITVGGWLDSIVTQPKDLLSPPAGGSAAMGGEGNVKTKGESKDLVRFETRGTVARSRTQPVDKWVDYAEEVFLEAATCRPRPGTGTGLNYDGGKTFDPAKCP